MNGVTLTKTWLRLVLITIGAVGGAVAFIVIPPSIIGGASKVAAVFLGAVWLTIMGFAFKVADVTEAPGLSPEQHEKLEATVRGAVWRVWLYAGANAVAAVFILIPSIIVDAKATLSGWMVVTAGAAIGFSTHAIIVHAWWQEELRRFRSQLRGVEREEKLREKLVEKLSVGQHDPLTEEERQTISKLHTKIDWPSSPTQH